MSNINTNAYLDLLKRYFWPTIISFFSMTLVIISFFSYYFALIAFLIVLFALFLFRSEKFIIILVALLPWAYVFKIDLFPTSLFVIICLISSIVFLIRLKQVSIVLVLILIAIFLLALLHFEITSISTMFNLIKLLSNVLLLYCLCRLTNKNNIAPIGIIFVLSVLFTCFVAFFLKDNNILKERINVNQFLIDFQFERFKGLQNDPNYFNSSLIISLLIISFLFIHRYIKFSFFVFSPLLVYFGLLTFSKSFFLLLILWGVFILFYLYKIKRYRLFWISSLLSVILFLFLMSSQIEQVSIILNRFTESGTDISTGRITIWIGYADYFSRRPLSLLFGNGFQTLILDDHTAHNTIIESFYLLGVFGTVLFFTSVLLSFSVNNVKKSYNFYGLIFSFMIFLIYSFLSGLITIELPFFLYFCYLFLFYNPLEITQQGEEQIDYIWEYPNK